MIRNITAINARTYRRWSGKPIKRLKLKIGRRTPSETAETSAPIASPVTYF
jgi:hypothetical protein